MAAMVSAERSAQIAVGTPIITDNHHMAEKTGLCSVTHIAPYAIGIQNNPTKKSNPISKEKKEELKSPPDV